MPAFRRKRPAQVKPDPRGSKLAAHGPPPDAVMVAKLLDLTKEGSRDRSADDAWLAANQLDHEQRLRLESLPQTPADNPEQDQDYR